MQFYCESLTRYQRLPTREVKIGDLLLGNFHPIRVQTMTTTDTMDTLATVEQSMRCIEAGAELVRITAPSKKEAENLRNIKDELRKRGYRTPLVADIHFTPNAAEIAARIVEKVRINPGNYVDRKKFELIEYTDRDYLEEIDRIRERFIPLIDVCKQYGTAMRIGTNHGSLSDRIMSRYGDTAMGMVESAMEFLRIARAESYHQIVLSMKSSNPQVMVQAYRLLVQTMQDEFRECYPLHLGVTEAGDGEDGRIKSAIGIGTLLEDGIGDTIRVSLTEDPELEIPVCRALLEKYEHVSEAADDHQRVSPLPPVSRLPYDPFNYQRRKTDPVERIGGAHVPVVIADLSHLDVIQPGDLAAIGYSYDPNLDKWHIADAAADFVFTNTAVDFSLPGTLTNIVPAARLTGANEKNGSRAVPLLSIPEFAGSQQNTALPRLQFLLCDCEQLLADNDLFERVTGGLRGASRTVLVLENREGVHVQATRRLIIALEEACSHVPVIISAAASGHRPDEQLCRYAANTGALLLDGMGDGIFLRHGMPPGGPGKRNAQIPGEQLLSQLNSIAFTILQATRTRISKTEYISCPSCGRTLFDLQETTARIRAVTNHLKGVKIAIMGCIVNGPGEMADADFGYVGSGPGRITLYRGKEIVKRNVRTEVAVDELINLLKENNAWVDSVVPVPTSPG